jgi:hypothetical protein
MAAKRNGRFDVGGVLLAQPFKIRRLGHFGLNVPRLASSSTARGSASASPTRSMSPSTTRSARN